MDPRPCDDDGSGAVEAEAAALRDGSESRKWLATITKATGTIFTDELPPRVRLAYDQFLIAAFERAARIFRSDLPDPY